MTEDFDDLIGKKSSDLELEPDTTMEEDMGGPFETNHIPSNDLIEYVFDTVRKTIKQENSLIRQIAYTGLSTYTNDPINLGIMAPTSEGKTYPVIQVMQLFPKQDVWNIGSMTPKVLVRMKGTPLDSRIWKGCQRRQDSLLRNAAKKWKAFWNSCTRIKMILYIMCPLSIDI